MMKAICFPYFVYVEQFSYYQFLHVFIFACFQVKCIFNRISIFAHPRSKKHYSVCCKTARNKKLIWARMAKNATYQVRRLVNKSCTTSNFWTIKGKEDFRFSVVMLIPFQPQCTSVMHQINQFLVLRWFVYSRRRLSWNLPF